MIIVSDPRSSSALHKKSRRSSSLCNLCVLCVSVVCFCLEFVNHRDTENTEVAQRNCHDFLAGAAPRPRSLHVASKIRLSESTGVLLMSRKLKLLVFP